MQRIMAAALAIVMAWPAQAGEVVRVKAEGNVEAVADALAAAVTAAGAMVAARIDHSGAAAGVGLDLRPEQLVIFGNPRLGTPAMQDDALAGLYLPLRVLVYQDADGQVWLAYEDPAGMLSGLDGIASDAAYLATMRGALGKLTAKAAKGE